MGMSPERRASRTINEEKGQLTVRKSRHFSALKLRRREKEEYVKGAYS